MAEQENVTVGNGDEFTTVPLLLWDNCTYNEKTKQIDMLPDKPRTTFRVHKPALEWIRTIRKKIAIISIAGAVRTGKSLVASQMFAPGVTPRPFRSAHRFQTCTYGIHVSAKTIPHPTLADTVILVLDVEGTGFHDHDKQSDVKLMLMALMLPSLFIFNSLGTFTRDKINDLDFLLELSEGVRLGPQFNDGQGLKYILPHFEWLLRDQFLKPTIHDKTVSVNKYFTNKVLTVSGGIGKKSRELDTKKSVFIQSFVSYGADALPSPGDDNTKRILDTLPCDELEDNFRVKLEGFCDRIKRQVKPKRLVIPPTGALPVDEDSKGEDDDDEGEPLFQVGNYIECTGPHFAYYIEEVVKAVNDPSTVPDMSCMVSAMMTNLHRDCKEKAVAEYKQSLSDLIAEESKQSGVLENQQIIDMHAHLWNELLNGVAKPLQPMSLHSARAMTSLQKAQLDVYYELCEAIGHSRELRLIGKKGVLKDALDANHRESVRLCDVWLNQYFKTYIDPMVQKPEQHEADQLMKAWEQMLAKFGAQCKGPAKDKCWAEFQAAKRQETEKQFKRMKGYSDKLRKKATEQFELNRVMALLQQSKKQLEAEKKQDETLHTQQMQRMQNQEAELRAQHQKDQASWQEQRENANRAGLEDLAMVLAEQVLKTGVHVAGQYAVIRLQNSGKDQEEERKAHAKQQQAAEAQQEQLDKLISKIEEKEEQSKLPQHDGPVVPDNDHSFGDILKEVGNILPNIFSIFL